MKKKIKKFSDEYIEEFKDGKGTYTWGMETNTQVNLKIISFTDKELILMRVGQNT